VRRPLEGEGEVAWRNYASSLEERVTELHDDVVCLHGRISGVKSGFLLRIERIERRLGMTRPPHA
jgi:hypothetical protein